MGKTGSKGQQGARIDGYYEAMPGARLTKQFVEVHTAKYYRYIRGYIGVQFVNNTQFTPISQSTLYIFAMSQK